MGYTLKHIHYIKKILDLLDPINQKKKKKFDYFFFPLFHFLTKYIL